MKTASYFGNPYIGLFVKRNNTLTLLPYKTHRLFDMAFHAQETHKIERIALVQSDLLGAYCVLNNNGIVVPSSISQSEYEQIKRIAREYGMSLGVITSKFVSIGFNVSANDSVALVNPSLPKSDIRTLADALHVDVIPRPVGPYKTVGSNCVLTNRGFVVNNNTPQREVEELEKLLHLKGGIGTINNGVPFVGLGIVANDHEIVFGDETTGFEAGRVEECLGFV